MKKFLVKMNIALFSASTLFGGYHLKEYFCSGDEYAISHLYIVPRVRFYSNKKITKCVNAEHYNREVDIRSRWDPKAAEYCSLVQDIHKLKIGTKYKCDFKWVGPFCGDKNQVFNCQKLGDK